MSKNIKSVAIRCVRPGPCWGADDAPPDSLVGWAGGHALPIRFPLNAFDVSISASTVTRLSAPTQHKFLATPMIRTRDARRKGPHTTPAFIITRYCNCNSCRLSYGIVGGSAPAGYGSMRSYVASQSIRSEFNRRRKERVSENKVINERQRVSCS